MVGGVSRRVKRDRLVSGAFDSATPTEVSLRSRSVLGVMWTAAHVWSVRLMSAVAFIVVGRQLEPAEFGVVALASGVIAILFALTESGLTAYIVRHPSPDETVLRTAFWCSLAFGTGLCLALLAAAGVIASVFDEPNLSPVLRWLSMSIVFGAVATVPAALLQRDMRFRALAGRGAAATLVGSILAIVLAIMGAGVWALVAQALVAALIGAVLAWVTARWRPGFTFDADQARRMLKFGSQVLSIDLLLQARDRGEEFVLAATATATTLGYWSVATRLIKLLQDTGSLVIGTVATPAFSKLQGDRERLARAYEASMAATGVIIFPTMLFLAASSEHVVPLVLGEQWATTAEVAQIAAVTAAVGVFSYFDRTVFVAVGRLRAELVLALMIVSSHLLIVFLAAPHGLMVMAMALLLRALATLPVRQLVLRRVARIPLSSLVPSMRVFLAALVMGAAVMVSVHFVYLETRLAQMALAGVAAIVVYPVALLVLARPVARGFLAELRSARA